MKKGIEVNTCDESFYLKHIIIICRSEVQHSAIDLRQSHLMYSQPVARTQDCLGWLWFALFLQAVLPLDMTEEASNLFSKHCISISF